MTTALPCGMSHEFGSARSFSDEPSFLNKPASPVSCGLPRLLTTTDLYTPGATRVLGSHALHRRSAISLRTHQFPQTTPLQIISQFAFDLNRKQGSRAEVLRMLKYYALGYRLQRTYESSVAIPHVDPMPIDCGLRLPNFTTARLCRFRHSNQQLPSPIHRHQLRERLAHLV